MQRLNIPLNRSEQITRRPRRVIWILATLLLFGIGISALSTIWFTRTSLRAITPSNTAAALHLTPSHSSWPSLIDRFGNMPLISNRSLSLGDLSAFTQGAVSLFFLKDGSQAVGIRSNHRLLPQEMLDKAGILVEEQKPGHFLLSSKSLTLEPKDPAFSWRLGAIGSFEESTGLSMPLYFGRNHAELRGPRMELARLPDQIPTDSILYLAMLPLPNVDIQPLLFAYARLTEPLTAGLIPTFLGSDLLQGGLIALIEEDEMPSFLLKVDNLAETSEESLSILKMAAALQSPRQNTFLLQDNSRVEEIIVDPESVTVEESHIEGEKILRAQTTHGRQLLQTEKTMPFLFSDSEPLIRTLLGDSSNIPIMNPPCRATNTFISLPKLLSLTERDDQYYQPSLLRSFSEKHSAFALTSTPFSTQFRLCF